MDLSGIIFVLLAVAWAGFLIPKALRHHDEAARTRSIDRFSASTRVLAHSEPVEDPGTERDTRLVTPPPLAPAAPMRGPATTTRAAARAAARRRRRILGFLLLCLAGTAGAAALTYLPLWSVAVPGGLTVLYLVLCRTQVRREVAPVAAGRPTEAAVAPAQPVTDSVPLVPTDHAAEPAWAEESEAAPVVSDLRAEDTVDVPVSDLRDAGLPGADGGSIWDPLPVTLPTYVTAPKAHRTVRTIELGEPGTWTSGRTAEDAEIAVQAAQPVAPDEPGRRAVGS